MTVTFNTVKGAWNLVVHDPEGFWQNAKRYFLKARSGTIKINGINFRIDLQIDPTMHRMYFKTYQRTITNVCKKFLKRGDVFIDVGANIGYISAFALGLVGKEGSVHAFEPVPRYLDRLRQVCVDNPGYDIHVNGVALGGKEGGGIIAVTKLNNIGWNTMVPDFMTPGTIEDHIKINVTTLSHYLFSKSIQNVRLVKIDTEGYEFPVIKGFEAYLRKTRALPIIIMEINPSAYPKLQASIDEFDTLTKDLGYMSFNSDLKQPIRVDTINEITDVVFIPG